MAGQERAALHSAPKSAIVVYEGKERHTAEKQRIISSKCTFSPHLNSFRDLQIRKPSSLPFTLHAWMGTAPHCSVFCSLLNNCRVINRTEETWFRLHSRGLAFTSTRSSSAYRHRCPFPHWAFEDYILLRRPMEWTDSLLKLVNNNELIKGSLYLSG